MRTIEKLLIIGLVCAATNLSALNVYTTVKGSWSKMFNISHTEDIIVNRTGQKGDDIKHKLSFHNPYTASLALGILKNNKRAELDMGVTFVKGKKFDGHYVEKDQLPKFVRSSTGGIDTYYETYDQIFPEISAENTNNSSKFYHAIINGYYDFNVDGKVMPFIGFGIGYGRLHHNLTFPSSSKFGSSKEYSAKSNVFAYQAMFGTNIAIGKKMRFLIEYRVLATTKAAFVEVSKFEIGDNTVAYNWDNDKTYNHSNRNAYTVEDNIFMHTVSAGLTYTFS